MHHSFLALIIPRKATFVNKVLQLRPKKLPTVVFRSVGARVFPLDPLESLAHFRSATCLVCANSPPLFLERREGSEFLLAGASLPPDS